MKDFLKIRRSTKLKYMAEPGPSKQELKEILTIAMRVPDHGKLAPWYFIIFDGEKRKEFGKHLRTAWTKDHPDATEEQLDHEENRFMQAPLVVAVISRIRPSKIPAWEQVLSAGAVCYNLCLACNVCGYGANWLTQWYSYHADIQVALNLEDTRDRVAGFIYIGTETEKQDDRDRPALGKIVNYYGDELNNKGNDYDKDGLDLPKL